MSFLSPTRTVLHVSDECLTAYVAGAKGVKLVDTVPWGSENFEKNVASLIAKDCGKNPVLILNDMVEQHYRKERVVRTGVGTMDRGAMVRRKLNVAFPNYSVRASLALKEKIPKVGSQPGADIYIFAAVANSDQVSQTISATKASLASVAGFCLLPIESSDMVKALSTKYTSKNKKKKDSWSIFIGQHRNGSLRQVLTKNGELALTRMSPVVDSDEDPDVWAREVYQEFKSTISYLSRFGYDPEDGLDVFLVSNPVPGEILRNMFEEECTLHIMSSHDAAQALNLKIDPSEDGRYAESLHVGWVANKRRLLLPMKAAQVDEVSSPRQVAFVAGIGLCVSGAFLAYQAASMGSAYSETLSNLDRTKAQKSQLDAQFQREVERLDGVGFNVRLVQNALLVHDDLEKTNVKTLNLLKSVGGALGKDLRVDSIALKKQEPIVTTTPWGASTKEPYVLFEATLKMTYPSTADVDSGNKEVEDLRGRLSALLPDHDVVVTKFLKDYEYTEGLVVEAGDLDKNNIQQDFIAEVLIKGPVIE